MKQIVYTVTQYFPNTNEEPIVTVFDNKDNAESCFKYYKSLGRMVCMDECLVCKTFKILL